MTIHLTRREMYDLVWTQAFEDVADRLGVSVEALRRHCSAHRVPTPRPKYWKDKTAGRRVRQALFVTTNDARLELISLNSSATPSSDLMEELERKRSDVARASQAKRISSVSRPTSATTEPSWTAVATPHSSLSRTANALRHASPDRDGIVTIEKNGVLTMSVGVASVERLIFILNSLVCLLVERQISFIFDGKEAKAVRGEESIGFKLVEKIVIQPHVPTVDELKAEKSRLRKSRDIFLGPGWEKAYPEYDRIPTGELCLSITNLGHDGRRRNWRDAPRSLLEPQLGQIADQFDMWFQDQKTQRLDRERKSRLWAREAENERLAEAREKRERRREAVLNEIVNLEKDADRLRTWLQWAVPSQDPDVLRMVVWATVRLEEVEFRLDENGFGDMLRERELFPGDDPLKPLPDDPDLDEGN